MLKYSEKARKKTHVQKKLEKKLKSSTVLLNPILQSKQSFIETISPTTFHFESCEEKNR